MKVLRLVLVVSLLGFSSYLIYPQISSHQDWNKLPKQCASCHIGHGIPGTAMLPGKEEKFCFQCHGDFLEVENAVRSGRILMATNVKNIRREFQKLHRHPVELVSDRSQYEFNQTEGMFNTSQAECLDCHRGHGVSQVTSSVGTLAKRSTKNENEFEYQLCYRCHSTVNQLSLAQKNIKVWFEAINPSYHPVEATGKNSDVPSLTRPYSIASIINCTDCHNINDLDGPRGPHSSDYEYLSERNYNLGDYISESSQQYEMCYKCHERDSILRDDSFPFHSLHVIDVRTSCFTCHNSHGSQINSHLIRFNEDVDPFRIQASSSGRLEFFDKGRFSGDCFLKCHNVDHNPKSY